MKEIQKAIKEFGIFNGINVENYVSYDYECSEIDDCIQFDSYIGKDVFEKHMQEWLEFFGDEDKECFLDIFTHYRYFTKRQYQRIMRIFYKKIFEKVSLEAEMDAVLIITFPSKKGVASGGDIVRATLEEQLIGKFRKDHIVSDTDKLEEDVLDSIKYIFFVDDIVGTGKTLYGNVKAIYNKLHLDKRKYIKLFVVAIYANENKIKKKLSQLNTNEGITIDDLYVYENTDKCFDTDKYFDYETCKKYKSVVTDYEKVIEKNKLDDDKEQNSILGFENGQLLVSFHYNTPNNTLSSFWRPSKISTPLFIRNTYIRPKIEDIRKNKKHCKKNGYLKRQLENGIKGE